MCGDNDNDDDGGDDDDDDGDDDDHPDGDDWGMQDQERNAAANCCSIPIAARKKHRPVFLDGMHQYQIASAVQLYDEDGVPAEGLPYGARRTVDKAPNLVEVA